MTEKAELVTTESRALTPMDLLAQAQASGASLEQLEKFMDLQERHEKRESEKAYNIAIADFKSKNIKILKKTLVDFQTSKGRTSYKHANLGDAVAQIIEGLCQCGLNHSWKTAQNGQDITVTCRISHIAGHSEDTSITAQPDSSGGKNSIQAIGSTITYLERYTLKAALGLAEEDDDGKGAEPPTVEVISETQWAELDTMLDQAKADREKFCKAYQIKDIAFLPAKQFDHAMKSLNKKLTKESGNG